MDFEYLFHCYILKQYYKVFYHLLQSTFCQYQKFSTIVHLFHKFIRINNERLPKEPSGLWASQVSIVRLLSDISVFPNKFVKENVTILVYFSSYSIVPFFCFLLIQCIHNCLIKRFRLRCCADQLCQCHSISKLNHGAIQHSRCHLIEHLYCQRFCHDFTKGAVHTETLYCKTGLGFILIIINSGTNFL